MPNARLRRWLIDHGLTQSAFAIKAGVGKTSVLRAINGEPVSAPVAKAISDATDGHVIPYDLVAKRVKGQTS